VSQAARAFGFFRPSFFQAQAAFEEAEFVGLLPRKRGPRGGHKLTEDEPFACPVGIALWEEYRSRNPDGLKVPLADLMDAQTPISCLC
jgi:hypothetical protein